MADHHADKKDKSKADKDKNKEIEKKKHYGVIPSLSGFGEFSIVSTVMAIASQIGSGDLTHITLPSIFCEPFSILEVIPYKRMRGMQIITNLPQVKDPLQRILLMAKWYLSAQTQDPYGKKPLNPILGETFRCIKKDVGWYYIAEQVSHHPPISVFHFTHDEYYSEFYGNATVFAIMGAGYVAAGFKGRAVVRVETTQKKRPKASKKSKKKKKPEAEGEKSEEAAEKTDEDNSEASSSSSHKKKKKKRDSAEGAEGAGKEEASEDGEKKKSKKKSKGKKEKVSSELPADLQWEEYILDPALPTGYARGLLAGNRYNELVGEVKITCPETGYELLIEFHKTGWIWGDTHHVTVAVKHPDCPKEIVQLSGKWMEQVKIKKVHPDYKDRVEAICNDGVLFDQEDEKLLDYEDLSVFGSSEEVNCSRAIWGATNEGIRLGDTTIADNAKKEVEDKQRAYARLLEASGERHKFRFFNYDEDAAIPWTLKRDVETGLPA